MSVFRSWSIKQKLMSIMMATSLVALTLTCLAFITFDQISTKKSIVRKIETLADVIGNNSVSALEFNDRQAARETLKALKAESHIIFACLYDTEGNEFARFHRSGEGAVAPPVQGGSLSFEDNHISYFHEIIFDGQLMGTIYLKSDLVELQSRFARYLGITVFFIAGSTIVAFLVAVLLQRFISQPILKLEQTARTVSAGRDYSIRAEKISDDEIGSLIEEFNEMLSQIQLRDVELQRARDEIEERAGQLHGELSERKLAEEARNRAESELAAQRTLSMRSDRLRSLGEMAAGIAHELNQPLVGVRGLAEHILIGLDRKWQLTEEVLRDRMGRIVEQSDRMVHIIEHIRLFAREAGNPEVSQVAINDVVQSAVDLLGAQFRSHGLEFQVSLADESPTVLANRFSLEEVLINLLSNARDAVESRRQRDPTASALIRLCTATQEGTGESSSVQVEIADSGDGIPEDMLAKIFDPFFTTKDPDKGTGLGLSISKSIVEQLGGALTIDSEPGTGTRATVSLPAVFERSSTIEIV